MEEKELEYNASVTEWLKTRGKEVQNWFKEASTQKAFINAGIILCHDDFSGEQAQELYNNAINEKDPKVKEKQNLIMATPTLAAMAALPGVNWLTVAGAAYEVPKAIKSGYEAAGEHDYWELYDQMANGIFSSLGLFGLKNENPIKGLKNVAKKVSNNIDWEKVNWFANEYKSKPIKVEKFSLKSDKFPNNKPIIGKERVPPIYDYWDDTVSAVDKSQSAVPSWNGFSSAKEFMQNQNVVDAQEKANRVAKMLANKYNDFKGANTQVGPNQVDISVEYRPKFESRGRFVAKGNGEGKIIINSSRTPEQQELTKFHETLHAGGYGATQGTSSVPDAGYGPTSYFNSWRAERLLKGIDEIDDLKQIKDLLYFSKIQENGNELMVNMATIGKGMGLNPKSEYMGPAKLQEMIENYRKIDPQKAAIFDLFKRDKDGNILYPGYVFKLLTGNFKNGGKL